MKKRRQKRRMIKGSRIDKTETIIKTIRGRIRGEIK